MNEKVDLEGAQNVVALSRRDRPHVPVNAVVRPVIEAW